jgi:hypothetical protein
VVGISCARAKLADNDRADRQQVKIDRSTGASETPVETRTSRSLPQNAAR